MIVIVDYKMGNLPNVKRAVELFTKDVIISSDVEEIKKADKILLPGVGAFGDAIRNIEELGLREAIVEASKSKPFMGICLGMQLMFEKSEEDLSVEGLGIIKGRVEKFKNIDLKIPEIGWNSVFKPKESKILNGLENNSYFYFVHSFHVVPEEEVATINQFGGALKAAIGIPEEELRKAAKSAVCKINIDSDSRLAMTAAIRKVFAEKPAEFDPRKYLGPARDNMEKLYKHKIINVLGSDNKLAE